MIVKWCRGRFEGSRDGSSPRDFICSHARQESLVFFGDVRIAQFVYLEQPPPIASIDTGVHDLQVLCSVGAWRGHVWVAAWDRVGSQGLGIIYIWYGMEKASRSPGSVVPRNVYYPNRGEN